MLRGHYTAKIDSKGRLRIPSEFLEPFLKLCGADRKVFLTSFDGKRGQLYPLPVWEEKETQLKQAPSTNKAVRDFQRTTSYWGRESALDASGRILIHARLREAGSINGEVSLFGNQDTIELCNHDLYRDQPPILSDDELDALSAFGI